MGGCCSAAQPDGVKLVGYAASGKGDVSGEGPQRHILRVKAQVLYLSYDAPNEAGGGLAPPSSSGQWLPVMKEAVFVALRCVKESEASYVYQVSASNVDGSQFCSYLEVPQVRLRKISSTFVFWKDVAQGKVLGLSFASERDTLRFLAGCTPVSPDIHPTFAMTTTHTSHSLPPAPPALSQQDSNEQGAMPPPPATPTNEANHSSHITPVPNHSTLDVEVTTDYTGPGVSEEPPFSPLSPLFPEEMNWTMSVLYDSHPHNVVDVCQDAAGAPMMDGEGSVHDSDVSSDCDPVTYIDDMSSQSDGEEEEEVTQPAQPGDPSDTSFKWDSYDVDNPALRFSFTLHDIPEAEEGREFESENESESEWSHRRAPPAHLTLPTNMSESSFVSSDHSFSTRPPSLPLSPAPGDLMSPTLDVSDASSPRYTALFDTFDAVESPIHEFDEILRELSKSISLDRIVSGDYPGPPISRTSTNLSTKESDFHSMLQHLRGEGRDSDGEPHVDDDSADVVLPSPRQRKISNESTSSQLKVSRSLDYLSEVVTYMERFSLDVDEQEVDQQEVDQQEVDQPEGEVLDEAAVAFSVTVRLPSDQEVVLTVASDTTVRDVVWESCEPNHYVPEEHFAVLFSEDHRGRSTISVPSEAVFLCTLEFSRIEIWEKDIRTVHLAQPTSSRERFGLTLEPFYAEEDEEVLLAAVVRDVAPGSPAHQEGMVASDEIVFFQDQAVFDLNWGQVLTFLNSPSVSLTLRSCRMALIQSRGKRSSIYRRRPRSCSEDFMIGMSDDVVEAFLDHREGGDTNNYEDSFESLEGGNSFPSGTINPQRQKMVDKVDKTVRDLLQSERSSLQHLKSVVDTYYKPLQKQSVPNEEISALFGGLSEAIFFKEQFLQDLQSVVSTVLDSSAASHNPLQRTKILAHRLSAVFLRHADRFRQCSSFCTSHCRLQHIMAVEETTTSGLRQFLQSLAPSNQLDLSLETMLAKPIQRVLQYPLYLHVVVKQMGADSKERRHLEDAISKMDSVVNYINDMQRISDSYTHVLDGMLREAGQWKLNSCVNMQQLKYHGMVTWLNPPEELAKGWRKGQGPDMQCFIFTAMIMLFVVEKKRRRTSRASLVGAVPVVMLEDLRYKTILLCSNCVARDLPDSDGVTNMCQFFSAAMGSMKACTFLIRSRTRKQKSDILQQFH